MGADRPEPARGRGRGRPAAHEGGSLGSWVLVRTRGGRQWLLIKHRDEYASKEDLTAKKPRSVVSGRTMAEIGQAAGASPRQLQQAAGADPATPPPAAPRGGRVVTELGAASRRSDQAVRRRRFSPAGSKAARSTTSRKAAARPRAPSLSPHIVTLRPGSVFSGA